MSFPLLIFIIVATLKLIYSTTSDSVCTSIQAINGSHALKILYTNTLFPVFFRNYSGKRPEQHRKQTEKNGNFSKKPRNLVSFGF